MWENVLDAFARYRMYILGAAGIVIVAVLTWAILDVTQGEGGSAGAPTRTPRATATNATEVSPTAGTETPTVTPTRELTEPNGPVATATPRPQAGGPAPTSQPRPPATSTPRPTNTPRPGPSPTPEPLGISIVSPVAGATVSRTFTIQVDVTGIELALGPGGQLIPGAAHWHIALGTAPPRPEQYATPAAQFGPVTPGVHTITVLLNLNDADLTVVAIDQVQITVSE